MSFSAALEERITDVLHRKNVQFQIKKMFGGLCFMVNEKMCLGIDVDKKNNEDRLMARIGEEAVNANSNTKGFAPMTFTGKPMKDYAYIYPDGFDLDADLEKWIELSLLFTTKVIVK